MSTSPNGKHTRNISTLSGDTIAVSPTATAFSMSEEHFQDGQSLRLGGSQVDSDRIVPSFHPYRTLVLCFDGTGDQFDSDNSNIVQFFAALKKDNSDQQMVYYQAGIGTYTSPEIATPVMTNFYKIVDMAIAWYLDAHVMGGYEFLMQNYKAGDRISIFGFSRGAYVARSLAGMIHKVGIIPACNHQQVPFAYKMYSRNDEVGWEQSRAFKAAFSVDANIDFLGVFDTVNSVGLFPNRLPFTTSNTLVKTFRHALSLDERRAKFKANLWNPPSHHHAAHHNVHHGSKYSFTHHLESFDDLDNLEQRYRKDPNQKTDIEEVWFAGCHCDVGGGSVSNDETTNLARIPLRWMIRECFKTNTGILFHADSLASLGLDPDTLQWPRVLCPRPPPTPATSSVHIRPNPSFFAPIPSTTKPVALTNEKGAEKKTEEEFELEDALSPMYDQLELSPAWWILEYVPVSNMYHDGEGDHWIEVGLNRGEARVIPRAKEGVKVHRSVKLRMDAQYENGMKYIPRANFDLEHVTWVD
ncbi:hypothetical protein BDP27DRAFT_1389158 [Rhodocollybia butyracea]|uniref:T6SS Phospholipase effector Tle1-like catalytic domain-containing protein n=1 Tax=Rhodocollybia butyracea TaxID=206335 RepID=A0A9P5Q7F2_9AGAR|nr:hypothetical protein BDP27DRAFT_1389158 [Rhodocollybia butyracea]